MGEEEDDHGDWRPPSEGQRYPETQGHQGTPVCKYQLCQYMAFFSHHFLILPPLWHNINFDLQ